MYTMYTIDYTRIVPAFTIITGEIFMRILISFLLLFARLGGTVYGGNSTIELDDGTVIQGEVIALDTNDCTIKTGSMGRITVNASKIRNISMYGKAAAAHTAAAVSGQDMAIMIERVKNMPATDPRMKQMEAAIIANPRFQELLNDPDIVNAARSGDYNALMSNKKLQDAAREAAKDSDIQALGAEWRE